MQQAIENHHPNKKDFPDLTVPITRKDHQKIHGTEPIRIPLADKIREYDKVVKLVRSLHNWTVSFEKDFGYKPNINLEQAIKLKNQLNRELEILIKNELPKVDHIQGFGVISLSGILAYAHPNRFFSLRKFLFYCGYKQSSRELKHYNHKIKPIMYNLVQSIIVWKDPKYYPLYLKMKEDTKIRHPEKCKCKIAIHRMAANRTATFLLKEVYQIWSVKG